jgi:hypothetical protein
VVKEEEEEMQKEEEHLEDLIAFMPNWEEFQIVSKEADTPARNARSLPHRIAKPIVGSSRCD